MNIRDCPLQPLYNRDLTVPFSVAIAYLPTSTMSLKDAASSKVARIDGGLGMGDGMGNNGSNGNTNNTISIDKSELSFLLDSKFETAAKRFENHIDTSIKGLREEMETIDQKHDKKHNDTNAAISALELKINNAVDTFANIAATNATTMQSHRRCSNLFCQYTIASTPHSRRIGGPRLWI